MKLTHTLSVLFLFSGTAFAEDKVYGGTHVPAADPAANYVVRLADENGNTFCTGTVYSENMIVTAGHCLYNGAKRIVIEFIKPGTDDVIATREVLYSEADPRYSYSAVESNTSNFNPTAKFDFAALGFAGGLPEEFRAVPRDGCDGNLTRGRIAVSYGFGRTGDLQPTSEDLKSASVIYSQISRDMLKFTPGNGEICPGDSGGPVFVRNAQGQLCWAGTNSIVLPRNRSAPRTGTQPEAPPRHPGCSTELFSASTEFIRNQRDKMGTTVFERWQSAIDDRIAGQSMPAEAHSFGRSVR